MKPSKECRQETETSISVWWEIYIIIPKFYKHSPCIFHFTVLQTELLNLRFRVLLLSCLFFNPFSSPATIFSFPFFFSHPSLSPPVCLFSSSVRSLQCLCAPLTASVPLRPSWQSFSPKGNYVTVAAALADPLPPASFITKYVWALSVLCVV